MTYPRIAQFKTSAALVERAAELGCELPCDDRILTAAEGSPLAAPCSVGGFVVGNRWCVQPMEGWDANFDGTPSELVVRRWRNFGISGAKLIWGGEAAAVQEDGRANPRQLLATESNRAGLARLLEVLRAAHRAAFETCDNLLVGLQLTHSGRFSRPRDGRLASRIAYHHPLLDARCGIDPTDDSVVWTDDDLSRLADRYVEAAGMADEIGFGFVDVKACHGYLLHEFLTARDRPGRFGGDLAGRSRLLVEIVSRIRESHPRLIVGVRLSAFDTPPFEPGDGVGRPVRHDLPYRYAFGGAAADPLRFDLSDTLQLIGMLSELGVAAINVSAGSPYYNPHIQRPATFPPSDGYAPPEDPLIGVCRQLDLAMRIKQAFPALAIVGTAFSYLQDFLPQVAQAVVQKGWVDFVGLGRMMLSYPELPADTLASGRLARKQICRTFSDCTTGPRMGLVSGCYPLDPFYKERPEGEELRRRKQGGRMKDEG